MKLLRERIAQLQESDRLRGDPEVSHCRDMNHIPQWNIESGCRGAGWQCLRCGVGLVVISKIDLECERAQQMMCWGDEQPSAMDILIARREYAEQVLQTYRKILRQDEVPLGHFGGLPLPPFAEKWFEKLSADLFAAEEDLAMVAGQIEFLVRYMEEKHAS